MCLAGRSRGVRSLLPSFGWKAGQCQGESENRRNTGLFIGFSVALATIVSLWDPQEHAETQSRCCCLVNSPLPDGSLGLRAADPMEAPSRAGIARLFQLLALREGQSARNGGRGVRSRCDGQGEEGAAGSQGCWVVKRREEGLGVRPCGNGDLPKGYPPRGPSRPFPHAVRDSQRMI